MTNNNVMKNLTVSKNIKKNNLMSSTITAVILTYNCEANLKRCLSSLLWVDEIIVVDMFSDDGTVALAKKHGAKVIQNMPENNNFDQNRKKGMEIAKSDYIMKIDSDEEITKDLEREIIGFLKSDDNEHDGINLFNNIYMFGQLVSHGFIKKHSHELRIFRKNKWQYDPYRFHQLIKVSGKTKFLKNYYLHHQTETVVEFLEKANKYTSLDSKILSVEKRITPLICFLSFIKTFLKLYIWQKGYLDKFLGLETSLLFAMYYLIEKIKIWEIQNGNYEKN